MPRHLDLGRLLLGLGALAVLVALFLDWFEAGGTGWEAFETLDLVLAGLAVAVLAALVRPAAAPALRLAPWAVLLIVVVQLLEPPPGAAGDPQEGAWLALAGALLLAAGAAMTLAHIRVSIDLSERRRPVAAAAGPDDAPTTTLATGPSREERHEARPAARSARLVADDPPAPAPAPEPARAERLVRDEPREVPAVDRRRPAAEEDPLERTQPLTPPPAER